MFGVGVVIVILVAFVVVMVLRYSRALAARRKIARAEAQFLYQQKRCRKTRKIGKRVFRCECEKGHTTFCLVRMPLEIQYLRVSHIAQGPLVPFKDIKSYMRTELGLAVT